MSAHDVITALEAGGAAVTFACLFLTGTMARTVSVSGNGRTGGALWCLRSERGQWTLSVHVAGKGLVEGIAVTTAQAVAITGGADIAAVLASSPPQLIARPLTLEELTAR